MNHWREGMGLDQAVASACQTPTKMNKPSAMVIRDISGDGTDGTLAVGISGTLGSQSGAPGLEFQGF
jgi:hypothetical protein